MAGARREPPSRDTVPGTIGDWAPPVAAIALVALLLILILARQDGDRGPAVEVQVTPPGPPTSLFVVERGPPSQGVIGQGTIATGGTWTLSLDGLEPGLCLTIRGEGEVESSRACASLVPAGSPSTQEAYQPVRHDDPGGARMVFGRMPGAVTQVEVILADGGSSGRVPVSPGRGGPFYAVDVTGASDPIAVFGYRPDGTSVRGDLPR